MEFIQDYVELTDLLTQNYTDKELRTIIEDFSDDKIRILVDATYLYHERPGNIVSFKEAFNQQKHQHLTKLHIYSSSNGWIFKVSIDKIILKINFLFRIPVLGRQTRGQQVVFVVTLVGAQTSFSLGQKTICWSLVRIGITTMRRFS